MSQEQKFEARFYFISDATLRINLADALQYITKLAGIYNVYEDQELKISFCKTITIYTASIIEACLHFCLKKNTTTDLFEEKAEWKYINPTVIYQIPETLEEIIWAKRKKAQKKIDFRHIKFQQLNKLCLEHKILDEELFDMCEKIKDARNKIHLANLSKADREYDKNDIDHLFDIASKILSAIERKLT